MDLFSFPPLAAALDLAYSALTTLSTALAPLAGASAAALAVVVVTLAVRAILIPAGISQARAEQVRFRLAPRLRELQRRYKRSPERLQREMQQLYRDENTSPFAGMLPMLAQAPIVGILYAVFLHASIGGEPNALLAQTLLGVPLGTSLAGTVVAGGLDPSSIVVFGGLILLIVAVAELTRRLLRMPQPPASADAPALPIPPGVLGALQFATAVVAVFVPLAAGLYLAVTVAWTLVQRLVLRRRYPLVA